MPTSIHPSANTWITARNSEYNKLSDQNCEIVLSQRIDNIEKVLVNADSVYVIVDIPETKTDFQNKTGRPTLVKLSSLRDAKGQNISTLDITKYVVEYAKWGTLQIGYSLTEEPIGVFKNNTVYYTHNAKKIILKNDSYKTKGNVSYPVFPSMIQSAFSDGSGILYSDLSNPNWNNEVYVNTSYSSFAETSPLSAQFRVYYTPLGESVKLAVPKTNPQGVPFCIPYSQQQPIVDNVSHGREMQSIANRTNRSLINPSKESSVLQW